jgi:predicted O-methyltransferase YrrM
VEAVVQQADCRYGKMYFFAADQIIGASMTEYGEWAQEEIDLLVSLMERDSIVVDVGAFVGTHTLAFARRVNSGGQVYAFEPQPDHFRLLQRNVTENGLTNVKLFEVGLSNQNEDMSILGPCL